VSSCSKYQGGSVHCSQSFHDREIAYPNDAYARIIKVDGYPESDRKNDSVNGVGSIANSGAQDNEQATGYPGHHWDLQPKSTMTNANVEQVVTGVDGRTLTVKYKDGEKKIIVPPDIPIVTFAPGDKADLKPGTKIFIGASKKLPDGTLQAARVNYGKDGLTPPM
jgi:hypothetical protein